MRNETGREIIKSIKSSRDCADYGIYLQNNSLIKKHKVRQKSRNSLLYTLCKICIIGENYIYTERERGGEKESY